jgi:outer membrane lipoprotein carrier protein
MTRLPVSLIVSTVVAVLFPAATLGASPEAARLERTLEDVRGLKAEFVQIRDVSLTGESIEAVGFLAFRPPHGFRLVYTDPEPQELVIQGDSLWVVMPSENQAQRYPWSLDAPGSEVFLLFGGHDRSLTEVFDVVEEPWGSYPAALRLMPKEADPGYPLEEIRLVVGKGGYPERLFFREVTGDVVVFNFTRIQRNPSDIDDLIRLRLPPGIDIIDGSPPSRAGGLPIDKKQ